MLKMLPVVILLLASPLDGFAQEVGPSIIRKSPFLPPNFQPPSGTSAAAAKAAKSGQFEFRGVYEMGGLYHFNLYNMQAKKGTWVTQGEIKEDTPIVVRYTFEKDELVVNLNGRDVTLDMIRTSDRTLPVRTATAAEPKPQTTQGQGTPSTSVRRRVIRPSSRNRTAPASTTTRRQTLPAPVIPNPNDE